MFAHENAVVRGNPPTRQKISVAINGGKQPARRNGTAIGAQPSKRREAFLSRKDLTKAPAETITATKMISTLSSTHKPQQKPADTIFQQRGVRNQETQRWIKIGMSRKPCVVS